MKDFGILVLRALCFTNSITWHFFIIFTRNLGPVLTIAIHINIPNPKYTYMNFKDPEIVKRNNIPDQTKHFFEHGPNTSLKNPRKCGTSRFARKRREFF